MMRQLWHVLFGHMWKLDYTLPVKFFVQYDIGFNRDTFMETHYSRCHCGLMRQGWSEFVR